MNKTLIIAEAGVNHNGDIKLAEKLIDVAAEAGVDYVKFQTFKASKLVTKKAKRADYQEVNTKNNDSQFEMLRKLELSYEDHYHLKNYCENKKVKFLSTGFDFESIGFLYKLGIRLAKIPSGEITNLPYLKEIARLFSDIVLSTGMADIQEVKEAVEVLVKEGVDINKLTILHCNTEYPTSMEDVNLRAMLHIQEELDVNIGYSDHTLGVEVPIAAVALGAKVIEKHFTLDRNMEGPDHRASLEPDELKLMVSSIRNIEKAMEGSGIKEPSKSELKNKSVARKSIHLSRKLKKDDVITEKDLISLRPGDGISSMNWDKVIGMRVNKNLEEFHKLNWDDLI
ncbi:N-acetylneuraminate synthase [Tenacibaculum skagerrakense]|uniref:N-acetylneuraminate synthase n=1 Tax=Tenacibaculum skagerrakense TaxID=186571 RepID=A0A4R2NMK8_9FLAO|nr:N-acetylneuraminate synthase [Tenacibaculum skagerrakense]TCP22913.1 N-acetylneuraminate synthase [Tenacibaculum skagerrakense]